MKEIAFSTNWNDKLSWQARYFTTIRLFNESKYIKGDTYIVSLKKKYIGNAILYDAKSIYGRDINDWMAVIDTGYEAQDFLKILSRMYKTTEPENLHLHYLLFKFIA